MFQVANLSSNQKTSLGVNFTSPGGEGHPNMLIVLCRKGYIMCGYLNMDAAEKFGDAAVIISGKDFDDLMEGKVKAASTKAKELGILEGISGKEAMDILNS